MKTKEITEGILAITKRDLAKVHDWLSQHDFEVFPIKDNYESMMISGPEKPADEYGFFAEYKGKKPVLKRRLVEVVVKKSNYLNRNVLVTRFSGIAWDRGQEHETAEEAIREIQ